MKRCVQRRKGTFVLEDQSPGKGGFATVAASGKETADSPEKKTQRNGGREGVGQSPDRQAPDPEGGNGDSSRQNQASIEDQPSFPQFEDRDGVLPVKIEVDQNEEASCPDYG